MNKIKSAVAVAAATVAAACLAVPAMAGTAPRYERALSVAAPSVTTDSATVTWLVPPQDAGASFEVLAYHADDPLLAAIVHAGGVKGASYTVRGLAPGTAYDVRVNASADGSHAGSGWTASVLVITTAGGAQGPAGPAGKTGPAGKDGANGTVGDVLHNSYSATVPASSFGEVAATCAGTADAGLPATTSYPVGGNAGNGAATGYVATGGGYSVGNGSGDVTGGVVPTMSRDELTYTKGAGWLVGVDNTTSSPQVVYAWVICAAAPADNPAT